MKVFSKKKFFQNADHCAIYCRSEACRAYVDEADGKPIVDGFYKGKYVKPEWLEDVYNPVEETGKILNTHFPNGFPPDPEPQAVNCRCYVETGKPPKHPRYKIVVDCAADRTFATMYVNDRVVKIESSKRNPADKFNWRIGAQTAFNRLWEKKKKPVNPVDKYVQLFNERLTEFAKEEAERIIRRFDRLPPAVREVKRYAEPGEYIKIVASDGCRENEYKNGDILKVVCADAGFWPVTQGVAFYKDAYLKYAYPEEYVVLEGYKPE